MKNYRCLAVCAVLSLVGCAPQVSFDTQYNRAVKFDQLKTFAWQENRISYTGARNEETRQRVDNTIRTEVVTALTNKGYTQVTPENADFLVSYHIVVTRELDTMAVQEQTAVTVFENSNINLDETFTIVYPDRQVGGSTGAAPGELTVRKGTLLLFIVDGESKRLMWQGTAAGTAVTTREALTRSRDAIRGLLDRFPPG